MRVTNQDLFLSTAVAMVLAAGCAPQTLPKPAPAAISSAKPTPQNDDPAVETQPANQPHPKPPEEAALAGASTTELIEKLADSSQGETAAVVLAKRGGSEAREALLVALQHTDWQVRARAAFALGLIGNEAADVKQVLEKVAADDPETTVRDAAAFALDAIAESAER